jgi:hypothetical protein
MYYDYQAIAKFRLEETERKAKHVWKFFEQKELRNPFVQASAKQDCISKGLKKEEHENGRIL